MIVVLDTNVWLAELGLNSGAGSALRFFIRHTGAKLALPEVVQLEVQRNLRALLQEQVETIQRQHRQLLAIFGRLKDVVLPTETDIEKKVSSIFGDVGIDILHVPFSLDSARSSFLKTINRAPPNGEKDQQFKDGVLWADCCGLLHQDDVALVTSDRAFFANRKAENGLAPNLKQELEGLPHGLQIHLALSDLLSGMKTEIGVDDRLLVELVVEKERQGINSMLARMQISLSDYPCVKRSLFATEDPKRLFVQFEIDIPCEDATSQGRTEVVLHLEGDAVYNADDAAFSAIRLLAQEIRWASPDGTHGEIVNYILLAGSAVFGHRDVIHTIQHKLD